MQMTVNREQLIEALTEKVTEVTERTQKTIEHRQKVLDDITPTETVVDWLAAIIEKVEDGEVQVDNEAGRAGYDGWIRVLMVKPNGQKSAPREGDIPPFPKSNEHAIKAAKSSLARAKADQAESVAPYEAALKLLGMSTDETIGIDAGDYHNLLGGTASKKSRRFLDEVDLEEDD